jgi:hypothetical protein
MIKNRLDGFVAILDVLSEMPWKDACAVLNAIDWMKSHGVLEGVLKEFTGGEPAPLKVASPKEGEP